MRSSKTQSLSCSNCDFRPQASRASATAGSRQFRLEYFVFTPTDDALDASGCTESASLTWMSSQPGRFLSLFGVYLVFFRYLLAQYCYCDPGS
jgi:hypothetical protein